MFPLLALLACADDRGEILASLARSQVDPPRLRFPVVERELILDQVMGVDHDPAVYEGIDEYLCWNYQGEGWPYCYDEHRGSDFDLVGGFDTMDAGSALIVAAADGVVEETVDGNYDRCHLDVETWGPDCDGHPVEANLVWLRHAGGWRTKYTHMMKDSVAVEVGQEVLRGEVLGRIGSSGWSTAPHLHLELRSPDGRVFDPYAGPFSQEWSYWCEQEAGDGLPGQDC